MFKKYLVVVLGVILFNSPANGMSFFKALWGRPSQATNPESLIPCMEDALAASDFREAGKLMMHYRIRVRMDASCCTDQSAIAAMDQLTIKQMTNLKFAEIPKHVSMTELAHLTLGVVDQIEQELVEGSLPDPEWVGKYGMNKYLRCPDAAGLFIDRCDCAVKQKVFLEQYKKDAIELIVEEDSKN